MANDCEVGLGAFIVTESIPRSWRVTEALEVGMVGVNLGLLSACESPFGGVKESGYGREGGRQGNSRVLDGEVYVDQCSQLANVHRKSEHSPLLLISKLPSTPARARTIATSYTALFAWRLASTASITA
jgi:hypothetical protein